MNPKAHDGAPEVARRPRENGTYAATPQEIDMDPNAETTSDALSESRFQVDRCLALLTNDGGKSRARSLAVTKMEEALFWLGEAQKGR